MKIIEENINTNEEIYLLLNYETALNESNFWDDYIKDKQSKINIPISLFALAGNRQIDILNNIDVIMINPNLTDKIVIKLKLNSFMTNIQKLRFFAVSYPNESPSDKLMSYKMINWNNILISTEFHTK